MRLYHTIFLICLLLTTYSCYEDYELTETTLIETEENIFYDAQLVTKILDEEALPMENVNIDYATLSESANRYGIAHFDASRVLHQGELLSIEMSNGFQYHHVAFPTRDDIHYNISSCYTNREVHTSNSVNFKVFINNQVELSATSTDFLIDNEIYTGVIVVEGYQLDLAQEENILFFPNARTNDVEVKYLNKKIGLHFNWTSDDGRRLSLSNNNTVEVQISATAIDSDYDVWYFNPESVLWELLPGLDISNGKYVFDAKADGYYCIAKAVSGIHVDGHILSQGLAVPNATLEIIGDDNRILHRGYTSSTGAWHAVIPAEERLAMRMIGICGEILKTIEIDAQNINSQDFEVIVHDLPTFRAASRSCENQPVFNSILQIDENYFLLLPDGNLNTILPVCPESDITLSVHQLTSEHESASLNWKAKSQNNIQSLFICDVPENNYIALRADGVMRYYEMTNTSIFDDGRLNIVAFDSGNPDFIFDLRLPIENLGALQSELLNISFSDDALGANGYTAMCSVPNSDCGFETFTLNHVGESDDEWICGEFEAQFWMRTTNLMPNLAYGNRTIEGEFRVKRNF